MTIDNLVADLDASADDGLPAGAVLDLRPASS